MIIAGDRIDGPSVKPVEFSEDDFAAQRALVRVYQNPDGSLTEIGQMVRRQFLLEHFHVGEAELIRHGRLVR